MSAPTPSTGLQLGLVERFEIVAGSRRRVMNQLRNRIQRLGDIVNRVGMNEEKLTPGFVAELRKMVEETEQRRQRVDQLRARTEQLQAANHHRQADIRQLLDRRETAMAQHENLVTTLREVYEVLQGETDTANRTLMQDLGSSFQALERSTSRVQDRRRSLNLARRSMLLQEDDGEEADEVQADDDGIGSAASVAMHTPTSTAPPTPRTPRTATRSIPQTPESGISCPFSPAPLRRPTAYDMPTVPFDLDEDDMLGAEEDDPETDAENQPYIRPTPGRSTGPALSSRSSQQPSLTQPMTPTAASSAAAAASGAPASASKPRPVPAPKPKTPIKGGAAGTPGSTVPASKTANAAEPGSAQIGKKQPPPVVPRKRRVVAAAAAAAAIVATGGDITQELSMLEDGPEARPVQLMHLKPEQIEEIYRQRKESRQRAHELQAHKCPTKKRPCDQCGERIGRSKEHYRCVQCGGHYCEICEKKGVNATCAPPPYYDKAARKRPAVAPGRNLEHDVYLDLQQPSSRNLLIPRIVHDCVKEIDWRVPPMGDQAEGIFRKSGSPEAVKQLRQAYLQGRAPFLRQVDVHDIADALKAYLRNLDEPLLTYRLYPLFIDVGRRLDRMSDEQIFEDLHRTLAELPPIYFFSAWYILRLLHRLSAYASVTKMDEKNFAVCIGPTLLRGPEATEEMIAVASGTVSKVVTWLIKFPRRRWDALRTDFLERSQVAFDISPVPAAKQAKLMSS